MLNGQARRPHVHLPEATTHRFLRVLLQARAAEQQWGVGTGAQKFLAIWEPLRTQYGARELKCLIELAVLAIHGLVVVLDHHGNPLAGLEDTSAHATAQP